MDKVSICVVGVGFWGRNHVRVFSELREVELKAVCDIDSVRAKEIAEKYDVAWYTDYKEMIKNERPDAISICTPTVTHAEIALYAIHKGVHALVEKPMASSSSEALRIIKEARAKGVKVMVGFIERFNPAVDRAKKMLAEGEIGELVLISARRVSRWPQRIGDVGVVKDLAIHDIDMVRYLTQSEPISIYAVIGKLRHTYEDHANMLMKLSNGVVSFIEANWLTPRKVRILRLTGSEGMITVDYITQEITVENDRGLFKPNMRWEEPLKLELRHFAETLRCGGNFRVTAIDGYKALVIAEAALRSSLEGIPIRINYEGGEIS